MPLDWLGKRDARFAPRAKRWVFCQVKDRMRGSHQGWGPASASRPPASRIHACRPFRYQEKKLAKGVGSIHAGLLQMHQPLSASNPCFTTRFELLDPTTKPMMGFKDFRCARIILAEIEVMHMIRKRQMRDDGISRNPAE